MTTLQFEYRGLRKVISGGQTGADQGGLSAAHRIGLKTGGCAPSGWKTVRGPNPMLAGMGLVCLNSPEYNVRTASNIRDSDATIILARDMASPGTIFTMNECKRQKKPFHLQHIDENTVENFQFDIENAARFIASYQVVTLNVAGNRDRDSSMVMHDFTEMFLHKTFLILKDDGLLDG